MLKLVDLEEVSNKEETAGVVRGLVMSWVEELAVLMGAGMDGGGTGVALVGGGEVE